MRKIVLVLMGLILACFVGYSVARATIYSVVGSADTSSYPRITAGIIRPDASGNWYVLNNTNHNDIGITGVTQTDEYINVAHATYTKIYSSSCDSDESLVGMGITAGFSVGLSNSLIYLYDRDGNLVDPSDVTSTGSNVWVMIIGY